MALEKKPLASKKALTTPASKSKRNVKGKVDTSKPSATKVATPIHAYWAVARKFGISHAVVTV